MAANDPFEFFLQWHLTERCNLRCRHCYQTGAGRAELALGDIRAAVAEAAEMIAGWEQDHGVLIDRSCNVTGGEPLVRDDLFEVLGELDQAGFTLFLLSNGTLIDRGRAEDLAEVGVKGVQISIEGPEAIHDDLRGPGSYQRAIRGTASLLDAGLTVTFNVTLSRLNAPHLEEIIAAAAGIGVQRVGFSRLVPSGQGASLKDQMLAPAEVESLYRRFDTLSRSSPAIVTGDPIHSQIGLGRPVTASHAPYGGCAAGVSGLTILPDGTLLPCRRLDLPLGNIRTDSLREIWATSEILNRLRDQSLYSGKCGTCRRWSGCRGCRAIAYASSQTAGGPGDYLASDPQCFID